MNPVQFISRRYLFSGKRISLVSLLTCAPRTELTIGTALLSIVLSVFNGFYDVIRGILLAQDPVVRVEHVEERTFLHSEEIESVIRDTDEVLALSPFLTGKSMLAFHGDRNEVVTVRGIETDTYGGINDLEALLGAGRFDLSVDEGRPGIILSEQVRSRYRMEPGDELALLSASGMRRSLTQFSGPRINRFNLRGVYSLQQIMDSDRVSMALDAADRLFNARNKISGYEIRLIDTDRAELVQEELQERLGEACRVSRWGDLQEPLCDVMSLVRGGAYVVLRIVVVVAVVLIVGSVTRLV